MVLTECPNCGKPQYNPILAGCLACSFKTPWMTGSPTGYQVNEKGPKHNYYYLPGGSLLAPGSSEFPTRENQSVYLSSIDLNQLIHEAASCGSPVWNIDSHGKKRLNVIYDAGRPTGRYMIGGGIVVTSGIRFALWNDPDHIHCDPENVPESNDLPYP